MTKDELRQLCLVNVPIINNATDSEREGLLEGFLRQLCTVLEGEDYMEYRNGIITNCYVNFDSCCGLSVITASIDFEQLLEYGDPQKLLNYNTLLNALQIIPDVGERKESWDDLLDENKMFRHDPEYIADVLSAILSDAWIGEEELRSAIKETPKEKFLSQATDFQQRRLMETAMVVSNIYWRMASDGALEDGNFYGDINDVLCNLAWEFEYTFFETDEYEDDYISLLEKWLPDRLKKELE